MLTYGIDVSAYQDAGLPGTMPGIGFVLVKATEGHSWTSPVQAEQAKAARDAGRAVGFYHFLWPGNIQEQAQYFVTQCASVPGDVLACDWETTSDDTYASCAEKDEFLAAVKSLRPAHRVVLYCNRSFWVDIDTTSQCGDGLWIADPDSPAGSPDVVHPWVFHQYSEAGGIDRDVYQGSATDLHGWMWSAGGAVQLYTVKSGDTMSGIAAAHHVTLDALESANPQVTNPDVIVPGQVLRIPS